MRSKFKWIFTLLIAFSMQFSFAQEKTITGVIAESGLPLPGVSVVVKGTTRGTQSDFDGKYSIQAKAGEVLVFSYLGFKDQTFTVGAANSINVSMVASEETLSEVVVVGYGTTTKEAYVGTATKVKMENVTAKTTSNITQALVGEVAGVNVINTSGQPGAVATIRIRGFGSVNGNRDPLYVVDGVPFEGRLNTINSSDVASLTILKDATATAVYGARGANGVVVITTRSGSANRSTIEVDFKTSVNQSYLPRYSTISSPEEYIGLAWSGMRTRGEITGEANPAAFANANLFGGIGVNPQYNMWDVANVSDLIDPATGQVRAGVARKYNPEDWEEYGFQASYRQEANLRFSGGNEKTRYFSSIGYVEDKGYIVNSDFKRYSTRLNLVHQAREWLKGTANFGYSVTRTNNNGQSADSGSIFWFVDNIPSIYPLFLRDGDGNFVEDPIFGGNQYDYGNGRGFGGLTNSIADATLNISRRDTHEITGNLGLEATLAKGLTFETRYGYNFSTSEFNNVENPFYGPSATVELFGSIFKTQTRVMTQNFLQLLRYKKDFGKHNIEVFVAHESNEESLNLMSISKNRVYNYNGTDLDSYIESSGQPSSYTVGSSLESYFGQASYNYDGKYFLTASARRDGSSKFRNKSDRWGTFGSVGASWIISKESFMENIKPINFLKVKASYGLTGDQAGLDRYAGFDTYSVTNVDGAYSVTQDLNGFPNLTWETAKIFQVGVESSLFGMLDVSLDYYVKNTDDLIFERRSPPSQGIAIVTVNDGQLRNSGLEFDVLAHLIKGNDFKLDLGINGEILKNKITKMPIDPATGSPKILDPSNAPYGWREGGSIYDFYVREFAGVDVGTGAALFNMYYDDVNGNGVWDNGTDTWISSLYDYSANNPNANIQSKTTTFYAQDAATGGTGEGATLNYVGKSAVPKVRGAFRLNAQYKAFDLTTQFTYSMGGYAYDYTYAGLMDDSQVGSNNWHTDIRDRWQQPGDITNVPRFASGADNGGSATSLSSRFLTKSDFLALNNVKLGYTFPSEFLAKSGVSNLNLFVSGDNLMLMSKRKGFNPATAEDGGSDTYRYSPLSTFTLGVRVEF